MSTLREQILTQLITDMAKITVSNGYAHSVLPGMVTNNLAALYGEDLPQIAVILGVTQSDRKEAGLDVTLKAMVIVRGKLSADTSESGLVTNETELWYRDFEDLFRGVDVVGITVARISGLWNIPGVTDYYISAQDPYIDDTNDTTFTAAVEITITFVRIT